ISPDGRWVASGPDDDKALLWDTVSGSPGPVLQGHTYLITGIAFSPNGQLIATSSVDHKVKLWDASTADVIFTYGGHSNSVTDVAFSPDGLTIASGSEDGTVRLWEVNSSRSSIILQDQIGDAHLVAYSPDGFTIQFVDRDRQYIGQGDATTGACGPVSFELPDSQAIYSIAFSAEGNRVAVGCENGSVRVCDTSTDAAGSVLEGHSNVVLVLAYSICGRWIASSDDDRIVRLWDLHDTEQQYVLIDAGAGGDNRIGGLKFSPTGHQLAVCSWCGKFWIFDPRTRVLLSYKELMEEAIKALDFSPDGQQLALLTETSITLWDTQSDERHLELKVPPTGSQDFHNDFNVTIAYSPCGQFLAASSENCIVHLWHRQSAEEYIDSWSYAFELCVFQDFIVSISWNPVVTTEFITCSWDGSVRIWRISINDGAFAVNMLWGTNIKTLCTADAVLEGATGLSPIHRKLFVQRGAIDNGLSSDDDGSDKDE
ncbi:hypothetical protein BGZ90_000260, partial [Linnemannia elongata]